MTIRWVNGIAAADIRRQPVKRLGVSLATKSPVEAKRRHAALLVLYDVEAYALIEQVRSGHVSVERVTQMVERHEALQPVVVPVVADPHSWGTVSEQAAKYVAWLDGHPRREKQTTRLAQHQLSRFEAFLYQGQRVGDMLLVDVPSDAIMAYQRSMQAEKRSVNVLTTYMSRVGSLWRFVQQQEAKDAREAKRAAHELYSPVDPEMIVRDLSRRGRYLNEAELERLFLATPDPLLFPVACAAMAGLRMEEVLHLRPAIDVDVTLGTVSVQQQADWKPKTRRSRRTVPMTDALRAISRRHLSEYANDTWMMPSPVDGSRTVTSDAIRKHFQAIVERAGMVYGIKPANGVVFHTLRHTFASQLAMRGVDLYTVAQLLGDSLQTTESVYAKLSPDFKRAAIAKLAGAFRLPDEMTQPVTQETPTNAN